MEALAGVMLPRFMKMYEARRAGQTAELNEDEINAALARLPDKPDENLR